MKVHSIDSNSFKAKLNIENVKSNTVKMQNIARLFSEKTMEYSAAEMYILPRDIDAKFQPGGVSIYAYENNHPAEVTIAELPKEVWEKLLSYSDSFISNKLTKMFKLCCNLNRDINHAYDDATFLVKRYGDNGDFLQTRENLFGPVREYMKQSVKDQIANDKILSTWNICI